MSNVKSKGMFSAKIFDSRVKSANVQSSERWLGYFTGPCMIAVLYCVMGTTYLNVFYTDVIKIGGLWGGMFLTFLPIISKIFDAVTNVIMGRIIDKTRSRQGKARPWILISGPLLVIGGVLLYLVPQASVTVQAIWIAVSYNLFFAFAYTIYNMSHTLMVPLSTRNHKQRDGLALFNNMAVSMLPGAVVYMVVPLVLLPWVGVDGGRWAAIMTVFSIIALPAVLIEYYFTKERITEESAGLSVDAVKAVSIGQQLKACLRSRSWIIIMLINLVWQIQQNYYGASAVYYANWVLGTYNDGITQTLINAVGQAPLGLGVFLLWPVVKKLGKRRTMMGGMVIAAVFSSAILVAPTNMGVVLGALFVKSFGMLPTYLMAAFLAEAMDDVEWRAGFRCDGISASVYSVIFTISTGISMGVFNLGLSNTGYIPPAADGSWVAQGAGAQNFFVTGFALVPALGYVAVAVLTYFFDAEKMGERIRAEILARHKAEAEARGEVYLSSEEKAAIEQAKLDRVAEEKRIEELKARCTKKGLDFAQEEAKYQEKKAKKRSQ